MRDRAAYEQSSFLEGDDSSLETDASSFAHNAASADAAASHLSATSAHLGAQRSDAGFHEGGPVPPLTVVPGRRSAAKKPSPQNRVPLRGEAHSLPPSVGHAPPMGSFHDVGSRQVGRSPALLSDGLPYPGRVDTASLPVATPVPASAPGTGFATPGLGGGAGVSRDEMNLAEFPLAVLSTRVDPSIKTLEFTDHFRNKNGELVERKWIITGADKFGLPTSTDDDVVLGLIRLTMDQGFRGRKIYFTRYELLKTLRWSTEGRSYSRLVKSLDRLSGVRIRSANSFYDNVSKSYQTCNFGIIDSYEINDHRSVKSDDGEPPQSFFVWSEMLFDSFRCGFIKKLDLDLYFSLRSSVSRRLYRYLDKHFYFRPTVERPLMILAFEKLGISRNYKYVSSIRQQLEPAAEELVRIGFLRGFEFIGKGEQTVIRFISQQAGSPSFAGVDLPASPQPPYSQGAGTASYGSAGFPPSNPMPAFPSSEGRGSDGYTEIQDEWGFTTRASQPQRPEALPVDPITERTRLELERSLIMRGITNAQSSRLVAALEGEELQRAVAIVSFYDFLVSTNDHRVSRNKLGFLYRAIEAPNKIKLPPELDGALSNNIYKAHDAGTGARPAEGRYGVRARGASTRPEHRIIRAADSRRGSRKLGSETDSRSADQIAHAAAELSVARSATVRTSSSQDAGRAAGKAGSSFGATEQLQREYREYFEHAFTEGVTRLPASEIDGVYRAVERKMTCLKSVLTQERFNEALEGCVREELMKLLEIPAFPEWIAGRTG